MLMVCPRCGFEQPEDQFCANCGLNVASYQDQPDPVRQRVLRHPLFFVSLAVLLALGLISYVKSQSPQTEPSQTSTLSSQPVPRESKPEPVPPAPEPTPTPTPRPSAPVESSRPQTKPADLKETQSQAIAQLQAQSDEAPKKEESEPSSAAPPPTQLQLQFWEVNRAALGSLGGEVKLDQPSLRAVRLADRTQLANLTAQGRRMGNLRTMGLRPSTSVHWDTPLTGPVNNVQPGLFLDLSVVKVTDQDVEIEVAGEFNSLAEESATTGGRFIGQLGVPFKGALVLSRMVPHQELPENTPPPTGVLTVLTSPEFLRQDTELILLLEPSQP